jgi:hypothetical protein
MPRVASQAVVNGRIPGQLHIFVVGKLERVPERRIRPIPAVIR